MTSKTKTKTKIRIKPHCETSLLNISILRIIISTRSAKEEYNHGCDVISHSSKKGGENSGGMRMRKKEKERKKERKEKGRGGSKDT